MRVNPHKYGESILLAISGGVDSLVMGELFIDGNAYFGADAPSPVSLAVAHCNFHLRGEESDGDAAFVKAWADRHGLKCYTADFQTEEYAREQGVSIEMAARELRYEWFDHLCNEHGFDGVCVAHNANDNAETLMLNLLRGTGVKGLCAMAEASVNPYGSSRVFRPMLGFTRDEIDSYANGHGLSWRTDSTNAQPDYKRNRIRNFSDAYAGSVAHSQLLAEILVLRKRQDAARRLGPVAADDERFALIFGVQNRFDRRKKIIQIGV